MRFGKEEKAARKAQRQAAPEVRPGGGLNARNTKRWCRGKVGVAHKLVVATRREIGKDNGWLGRSNDWLDGLVQYCATCGKEFDSWTEWGKDNINARFQKAPPAWAVEHLDAKKKSA